MVRDTTLQHILFTYHIHQQRQSTEMGNESTKMRIKLLLKVSVGLTTGLTTHLQQQYLSQPSADHPTSRATMPQCRTLRRNPTLPAALCLYSGHSLAQPTRGLHVDSAGRTDESALSCPSLLVRLQDNMKILTEPVMISPRVKNGHACDSNRQPTLSKLVRTIHWSKQ